MVCSNRTKISKVLLFVLFLLTEIGIGILSVYERFVNELKRTYDSFIDKTENDCRTRLKDDFVMFTRIVDWELLSNGHMDAEYVELQV